MKEKNKCKNCDKELDSVNAKFCSKDCYVEYRRSTKTKKKRSIGEKIVDFFLWLIGALLIEI